MAEHGGTSAHDPESDGDAAAAPAVTITVRVEAAGATAERAIATAVAAGTLRRDHHAPLQQPAAAGELDSGDAVLDELVRVAALSLDDADLHLTAQRR